MLLATVNNPNELRELLSTNFLEFTKLFYKFRTGRDFIISQPIGRLSHQIIIAEALQSIIHGKCRRLMINVPPRYGKTELVINFIAWALALYPDSNFIYTSYAHSLAKKQTQTIRNIITMNEYKHLFGVSIKEDTSAKDNFETNHGGSVYAVGAQGAITGRGAGIYNCDRFGGCIVIDDIHKPNDVASDTIRESTINWYSETLQSRVNDKETPIIFIGQRLHENDLASTLRETKEWDEIILPALDLSGNALNPIMHDVKMLKTMQEKMPYVFASQYQQDPQPAGGGIFKADWFDTHEIEPEVFETFLTIDTAETDKDYNDATVFSFWGVYYIKQRDIKTEILGLHWLNCWEMRIEPKDLQDEFFSFYRICMGHKIKPSVVLIERKSTGTTLVSSLRLIQGLHVLPIERTKASGSKISRYLEMQPYIASRQVSLPSFAKHTSLCIEHMRKITANDTHRFDDICDTAYDAVKFALMDKAFEKRISAYNPRAADIVMDKFNRLQAIRGRDNFTVPIPRGDINPFGK